MIKLGFFGLVVAAGTCAQAQVIPLPILITGPATLQVGELGMYIVTANTEGTDIARITAFGELASILSLSAVIESIQLGAPWSPIPTNPFTNGVAGFNVGGVSGTVQFFTISVRALSVGDGDLNLSSPFGDNRFVETGLRANGTACTIQFVEPTSGTGFFQVIAVPSPAAAALFGFASLVAPRRRRA